MPALALTTVVAAPDAIHDDCAMPRKGCAHSRAAACGPTLCQIGNDAGDIRGLDWVSGPSVPVREVEQTSHQRPHWPKPARRGQKS